MRILRILLAKFMSLDDETEATIVSLLGLIMFGVACYTDALFWWFLLVSYLILVIFVGILEEYVEKENKRAKKNHDYFVEQTRNYLTTIEKCDSFVKI